MIWAKAPDRFEAGTPAIVNVIAFAMALRLLRHFGKELSGMRSPMSGERPSQRR